MNKIPYRSQASLSYLRECPVGYLSHLLSDTPISTGEDLHCARDTVCFTGICLHTDAASESEAQQVVYNLKALFAFWIVGTANVHQCFELALRVVA